MEEKVSILMPNYNNGPYLRECIDSILAQSYRNYELIIVDDASTDNSLDIIRSYHDDRIALSIRSSNGGIVAALNDGLKQIHSKYIIRHDGDDLMHPERIKTLVDFMENNPEIDVCSSDIRTFGAFEKDLVYERNIHMNKANLIFGHSIGHASSIFRTALFKEYDIQYTDEYLFKEDYALFYQLKDKANTTSIEGFYYLYRVQERHDNASQVNFNRSTTKRFYERVLGDLKLNPGQRDLDIHFELAKNVDPTFKQVEYKAHIASILEQNKKWNLYPSKELKSVLLGKYYRLLYKKIDNHETCFWVALKNSLVYRKPFLRYWFAVRSKRN